LLSEDAYLLEGLQSADKTITHPKATIQNASTFAINGNHSHVCLLFVIKIKTSTYQLCKRQSAATNVLIGRHRLSARRLILIISASLVQTISQTDYLFVTSLMLYNTIPALQHKPLFKAYTVQ